ncbi:hypothetical protein PHYBOEH_010551 [Phytophthora boehmeriae]|uniref:Transmembrane protein n=1 Tax=Phytophthora boehmeriae TaxID=109152 RepID=A0A8T1VLR3_9STRA|nr:hypothetical protein PHYBOEH_010551 [Phytophthora boehmeriae]
MTRRTQSREESESSFIVLGSPHVCTELAHLEMSNVDNQSDKPKISVWDRRWFGLVLHSVAVAIVSTVLPLCVYPFLTCNLNMEGTQTLSARALLGLPWALKPMLVLLIDCLPLPSGCRLRLVTVLGWAITSVALIGIFYQDQPTPYFQDRKIVGTPLTGLSAEQMTTINSDAPSHGAFYVMLMCVATVGYVMADVAADVLISDIAIHYFGATASLRAVDDVFQAKMTQYRTIGILGCFPFMGFAMSGWDYGGDFDFSLEYTQVMLLVGLVGLLPMLSLAFTVSETPRIRRSFRKSVREIWVIFSNSDLNRVLICRFAGGVFAGVSATAVNPVAFYYAGVQPLNDTVVSFVAIVAILLAMNWVDKKGWVVDYRLVIVTGTIVALALDCGATMFTIWDVVRSQWFWIGLPVMEAIPSAIDYTIFSVILAKVVDPKVHTTVTVLVTGVSFLAGSLGLTLTKYVDELFDVTNQDVMTDTSRVREHLTVTFLIAYTMQLASLVWLIALPKHAVEVREWKELGGTSTVRGACLLALLSVTLPFVVAVHVLSVFKPMAFAGGD